MGGMLQIKVTSTSEYTGPGGTLFERLATKALTARRRIVKQKLYRLGVAMVDFARNMVVEEGWYITASLFATIRLMKRSESGGRFSLYEWMIGGINPSRNPPNLSYPRSLRTGIPSNAKGPLKYVGYALIHEGGMFGIPVSPLSKNPHGRPKTPQGTERPLIRSTIDFGRTMLKQVIQEIRGSGVPIHIPEGD